VRRTSSVSEALATIGAERSISLTRSAYASLACTGAGTP
jgi:hypothetical protein